MGIGSEFQEKIMDPSYKMGRQLEDWVKVTFMGDSNGIEGLRKNKDSGTDLGKLRRDAVANGFNPLTVLRATGGQGFYKNEIPMGRLSSAAFFNTFDRIKQRKYNVKSDEIQRGRDDIPTTVVAYDPTGAMPDFRVVNPELIESSANEALSSAAMIASQYVAQHGGDYETVLATIQNINQARKENEQDPIRLKNNKIGKSIYEQITNAIGNSLDGKLQSFEKIIGYDRNEKILVTPILQQQRVMEELFP
jgi:hypothetical protein